MRSRFSEWHRFFGAVKPKKIAKQWQFDCFPHFAGSLLASLKTLGNINKYFEIRKDPAAIRVMHRSRFHSLVHSFKRTSTYIPCCVQIASCFNHFTIGLPSVLFALFSFLIAFFSSFLLGSSGKSLFARFLLPHLAFLLIIFAIIIIIVVISRIKRKN